MKREGWAFYVTLIAAAGMLACILLAATCKGQAFTAPGGQYRVENGQAVLNGGCGPNGCPSGQCPAPQPWQAAPPRYQRPMVPLPSPLPQQTYSAVCRVKVPCTDKGKPAVQYGTGTLVDVGEGYGLVITAAHVMGGSTGNPTCIFPDGRQFPGSPVRDKDGNDLAAILIQDPGIQPVEVAAVSVPRGEVIVSGGYGQDGRYLSRSGFVVRVDNNVIQVSGSARDGDSGGPILNRQDQLVGVLWGTKWGVTYGTTAIRTDVFLTRAGRYLLPWNAKINDPARDPRNQPPPVNQRPMEPYPPPVQGPTMDPALAGQVGSNTARIGELERRADTSRDALLEAAAKFEKELPGVKAFAEQKAAESAALAKGADEAAGKATRKVDEALDEDNPKGIIGKIKARIEERFGASLGEVSWMKYGVLGLIAAVVVLFVRKDFKDRRETGDPLLIEKLLARVGSVMERTTNTVDDRALERLERRIESIADRVAPRPTNPTQPQ